MLETPRTSHLKGKEFSSVYEPAEDTFLLLDALEAEMDFLRAMRPNIVLEIGSGSGVPITFLAKHLKTEPNALYFACDINKAACEATERTAKENGCLVNVVQCDLASAVLERLQGSVDVLLFNAPYVPTDCDELKNGDMLSKAWAGGVDGCEVINRLFPFVARLLSARGAFYLVCIAANNIDALESEMRSKYAMRMSVVANRRTRIENLYVLKFTK